MPIASLAPLPLHQLTFTRVDDELVPAWFSDRDRPWLRDLLQEAQAFVGRPVAELLSRWRRSDDDPRAGRRLAPAQRVLLQWLQPPSSRLEHTKMRQELFAAAANGASRREALATVATSHARASDDLMANLFADLPHARALVWPKPAPSPSDLAIAINRCLAQGMLRTAHRAELRLVGCARTVLRTAWLHATNLVVVAAAATHVQLRWQCPEGDARAARRLASLVPLLPWARDFELRAACRLRGTSGTFVLTARDAILPGPEPRAFDSALERHFANDFLALAHDWELLREPAPLVCGSQLAFPDFLARRRSEQTGWWIEIAGLRDRSVLPNKLALLAQEPNYVLCLPRHLVPTALLGHAGIVAFTHRVHAEQVLARLSQPPQRRL